MSTVRALVTLERDTGLPVDVAVNNWYFQTDSTPASQIDLTFAEIALIEFYNNIDGFLSSALSGQWNIRWYDLDDPEPRVPIRDIPQLDLTVGNGRMPGEVACAFSYHGEFESGEPNARRRGRVFLGPLDVGAGSQTTGGYIPSVPFRTALAEGGTDLLDASISSADWEWVVYSPTTRGAGPAASGAFPVVAGWIDNAFDTIRSRGLRATARTLFEPTPGP